MDPIQAAVLGAVQGLTEFLPISSKSHLIIVPTLLGWQSNLTFDVAVHWATLLAVVLYFRADWIRLLGGTWRGIHAGNPWRDPDGRLFILLLLASIPVMIVGLALRSTFEAALDQEPLAAARLSAALLLVTGVILVVAESLARRWEKSVPLDTRRALAVGIAQATAILPGISRSGVTIAAGLSSGLAREDAARFSFLLSTPTIFAAGIVQAASRAGGPILPGEIATLAIGFGAAFVVGYVAIAWLIRYLSRAPLYAFAVYTWVFGLATLWLLRSKLALSTMYFQRWADARDLAPFFELGCTIGFEQFELSHILAPATVAAVDPRQVTIAAVHHPCPLPPDFDPADRLTSADPRARARAAQGLRATVETAARLCAPAVVVHLGYVEDTPEQTGRRLRFELESRYLAGQRGTPAYALALDRLNQFLAEREAAHIDRAIAALPEVLAFAAERGVRIGLETGYHAHELPAPAGMRRLLDALGDPACGAWLDTGHVGAQVNLGRVAWDDWWAAVGGRWIGVHLHDIVGLRDHLVPGMGELDFAAPARQVPADAVRTCEIDWYFSPGEVEAGVGRLRLAGWLD